MSVFFIDTATSEIYTLALHAALPISPISVVRWDHGRLGASAAAFLLERLARQGMKPQSLQGPTEFLDRGSCAPPSRRSEEHTSELQSRQYLVCRFLLEKKNKNTMQTN